MSWLDLDQTDRGGKDLSAALTDFAAREGDDTLATLYRDFLRRHPDAFLRSCHSGHFTGSAWVVSADGQRSLLTHHKKLGRWLQPGGHADGDTNLARVALREAEEETGLSGLRVAPAIFDLDRHRIPARGVEPEHWHYDVRYVVRAGVDENFVVSDESNALAWREITALASDDTVDPSLRRMAQRWVARQPV
ncbi:MAG TPA: NUDIX hydrolase [Rhodanobacteraceae bacterium]|nr:NUDIX hydrolase [Rhodanobacteraceae bacterium]